MTRYADVIATVNAELGQHAGCAVDTTVTGALMSSHAREHCADLADAMAKFIALLATNLVVLGGLTPEQGKQVHAYALQAWGAYMEDEREAAAAEAMIERGQLRPEDVN